MVNCPIELDYDDKKEIDCKCHIRETAISDLTDRRPSSEKTVHKKVRNHKLKEDLSVIYDQNHLFEEVDDEEHNMMYNTGQLRSIDDLKEELLNRCERDKYMGITISVAYGDVEDHIVRQQILIILREYTMHYTLLPAIQKKGRIHWHGFVCINRCNLARLKRHLTYMVGFCRIECIQHSEDWIDYITDAKQQNWRYFGKKEDIVLLAMTDVGRYNI